MNSKLPPNTTPLRVLRIDASSRYERSITRQLTDDFVSQLDANHREMQVEHFDLARAELPYINEDWITANFTPVDQRTPSQKQTLAQSDGMVNQLRQSDILVLGVPVYNFSVPAALKAWIDLVARAGVTFHYTENGPVGLLENKKAYVIVASGGTPIGSAIDFASGYLRHVLGFLGIHDVEVISAERINARGSASAQNARQQIDDAVKKLQQELNVAA
jgi:FMN-dependent NADH-azoreductase